MNNKHLRETELAHLDDGSGGAHAMEHLRWCALCRSAAADYRWLRREVTATLMAAADVVPVPSPKWRAVQRRLSAGRRREVVGRRVSAIAGAVSAMCLMLSVSLMPGTIVAAGALSPDVAIAPAPITAFLSGGRQASVATPTPAILGEEATSPPTPTVGLPPTPPGPEV